MALSCEPNDLVNSARGMQRVPRGTMQSVKAFLMCAWANAGGGPPPPVPPAIPTNLDVDITSTNGNTILTWSNSDVPTTNEIWSSPDNVAFAFMTSVGGGIHTYTDPALIPDNSRKFYKVRACNGVTCSTFSSVVSVAANISGAFVGPTISEPTLKMVYGVYDFSNSINLTSVILPAVKSISGMFTGTGCGLLALVNCHLAITIDKIDFGSGVPNLNVFDFTSLVTTPNGFYGNGTSITTLSLPNYVTSGSDFSFPIASLTSISLPLLQSTIGNFNLSSSSISTLSLPSFTQCGIEFNVSGSANLTTITANSFGICGDFIISSCPNLTAVNLNSMTNVGSFNASSCNLMAISLNALTNLNGDFIFSSNTALSVVNVNNIIFPDGPLVHLEACALSQASVDLILHRGVVSGTTSSDYDLSMGTNATPSAAGLIDKTSLQLAGNTVTTN